jgi:hypothetical protein
MSYQRKWLEREGSEDSHARALWATGTALGRSKSVARFLKITCPTPFKKPAL